MMMNQKINQKLFIQLINNQSENIRSKRSSQLMRISSIRSSCRVYSQQCVQASNKTMWLCSIYYLLLKSLIRKAQFQSKKRNYSSTCYFTPLIAINGERMTIYLLRKHLNYSQIDIEQ